MKKMAMSNLVKTIQKFLLVFVAIIGFLGSAKAQPDSLFLNPKYQIETLLPTLDSLYEIAVSVNPSLKQHNAAVRASLWAADYNRWIWGQNTYVFANYSFGSLPFFAYPDPSQPQSPNLIQVREGYRAGINIQFSIFDIMGHRGRVNEHKERALMNRYLRDAEAMELRRKLSLYYTDAVGYGKLYRGRNEDLLTQMIACQVAEKEYREGTIHISEFARQKNVLAVSEAAYNEAFRFFYGALEQLEAVLGVPLHTVMIQPKYKIGD